MTNKHTKRDITATYSAEDNKLRLYCASRLDDQLFQHVKAAGFKWARLRNTGCAGSCDL